MCDLVVGASPRELLIGHRLDRLTIRHVIDHLRRRAIRTLSCSTRDARGDDRSSNDFVMHTEISIGPRARKREEWVVVVAVVRC